MIVIHIDIYVPALDESFEFRCDEEAPVSDVCRDISDYLMYRSGAREPSREVDGFWLCDIRGRQVLSADRSLKEQRVIQGSRMIYL